MADDDGNTTNFPGDDAPTVPFYPVPAEPIRPWAEHVEDTLDRVRAFMREPTTETDGPVPPRDTPA